MFLLGEERNIAINIHSGNLDWVERYAQAGFTGAELDTPVFFSAKRDLSVFEPWFAQAHPLIREAGLQICSIHLPFGVYWDVSHPDEAERSAAVEDFARVIRMTETLDGRFLVLHPSAEPNTPEDRPLRIDACRRSIGQLAAVAREIGKELVIEDLPRTCLGNTSAEMQEITDGGALARVCMDTTHLFHETVPQFMDVCGPTIAHTHLSDYLTGQDECHWVPGTGDIPWREVFTRLTVLGYKGAYMFEMGKKYAPLEIITGLKNALRA